MRRNKDIASEIIDDEQKRNPEEDFGAGIMDLRESTGAGTIIKPITNEGLGFEPEKLQVRYMEFGKYRIGLIEKDDHEVVGIQSVEETKKLFSDEQLSKRFNYWDVEKYYKKE